MEVSVYLDDSLQFCKSIGDIDITTGMYRQFLDSFKKHTLLVSYFWIHGLEQSVFPILSHDRSKTVEPELSPYILIVNQYRSETGKHYSIEVQRILREATIHHVRTNAHHPEFWDPNWRDTKFPDIQDRDGIPLEKVDARLMPTECLQEMVCDWAAVSVMTKGSLETVLEWCHKVCDNRFNFVSSQLHTIHTTIDTLQRFWYSHAQDVLGILGGWKGR